MLCLESFGIIVQEPANPFGQLSAFKGFLNKQDNQGTISLQMPAYGIALRTITHAVRYITFRPVLPSRYVSTIIIENEI